MSFSKKSDSATLHNAIKRAYNAGILMVASTGNEGSSDEDNNLNDIKYNFVEQPEMNERELLSMEKEMLGTL